MNGQAEANKAQSVATVPQTDNHDPATPKKAAAMDASPPTDALRHRSQHATHCALPAAYYLLPTTLSNLGPLARLG